MKTLTYLALASLLALPAATTAQQNPRIVQWSSSSQVDFGDDLISLGYPVPIPVDTPLPFDGFRTYNGIQARHLDFTNTTDLVRRHAVGESHLGRPVWAYTIGDAGTKTPYGVAEAASLLNGGIHAREWQSPEVATGITELLIENAGDGHLHDYLLAATNTIIIPVLNPDGFIQTQRYPRRNWYETDPFDSPEFLPSPRDGRMRRKNMLGVDEILTTQADHLLGVDLNRNFSPYWANSGSSSSDDRSLVHHGAGPLSEPENQALDAAAQLGPAAQLRTYTDVHSFSQVHFHGDSFNPRLNAIRFEVLDDFTDHHRALPGNKWYAFGQGTPAGSGAGFTYEYFTWQYNAVSWLLEVEPSGGQPFHAPLPGTGADYGGANENGHDGFILPESEITRVRENLARSFAATYYQMAGPPAMHTARLVDSITGAVVWEGQWQTVSASARSWIEHAVQPLQLDRDYEIWVSYDKPMRWIEDGTVVPFPGQSANTLDIEANALVGGQPLTVIVGDAGWLIEPGDAPAGFQRWAGDAYRVAFRLPINVNNDGLVDSESTVTFTQLAWDMVGQATDADPATVARWQMGNWVGYEDGNGLDVDTGGVDANIGIPVTRDALGDPFVLEPGASAAWFDPDRNGEGFVLEMLAGGVALAYWFTYDADGEQDWYIMVGEVRGNRIVFGEVTQASGGMFGPGFDPASVTTEVVGSASFTWSGCDSGWMTWHLGDTQGTMELRRITSVMGLDCGPPLGAAEIPEGGYSGSWFDPAHNGEGYVLEVLAGGEVLVYWFTFDGEGNRRWFFGVGEVVDGELVFDDLLTTSGPSFGAGFDPAAVQTATWGQLSLDIDCSGGTATWTAAEDGFPDGQLQLQRLTTLDDLGCTDG